MNSVNNLKDRLKIIKENNYEVDAKELKDLVPQMLDNIGNPDAELRDKLIYVTFYYWIFNEKFSHDELKELLNKSISKSNLFYHVGDVNTDTVFTRSFSVLLIPLILHINEKENFLKEDEILKVYNKLIEYFKLEKDYRGYVVEKGWAHSIAHAADALGGIASCDVISEDMLKQILDIIKDKFITDTYLFVDEEDERLVLVVYEILKRNILSNEVFEKWIDSIVSYESKKEYPADNIILLNAKGLLRSLYFRIYGKKEFNHLSSYIKEALDKLDIYKKWVE